MGTRKPSALPARWASDTAPTELLAEHPGADAQRLRTLIRNARREHAENKPPKASREIFQILKQLQGGAEPAAADMEEAPNDDAS